MNILSQTNIKAIYRVTGTPENFLTALRYKVWGFNHENQTHWKKLQPGDIIFFHSKGSDSKFLRKPKSGIIGFAVVGNHFYFNETKLWIDEKIDNKKYPFRFTFSELYLFSSIPINDDWDSTSLDKEEVTKQIVGTLIDSAIPLSDLEGFPHMGSYSAIQNPVVKELLLGSSRDLNFYQGEYDEDTLPKPSELKEIYEESEALRHGTTLTIFDDLRKKIVSENRISYDIDTAKLARAETSHFNVVSYLLSFFKSKNYHVFSNSHIDLFAFKGDRSILVEAKSIENKNFIPQSRKGIVQLFEYNYFEIAKFKIDRGIAFSEEVSLLATSDMPKNLEYVDFVNSLNIKTLAIKDNTALQYGKSLNLKAL